MVPILTILSGSCNGRGPRCAGWFADYVAQRAAQDGTLPNPKVYTLEGGIKGWVAGGPAYTQFVDGYVQEYWLQFDEVKTAGKRIVSGNDEQQNVAKEEDASQTKKPKNE
jgi:arsenical-resistance protein 2